MKRVWLATAALVAVSLLRATPAFADGLLQNGYDTLNPIRTQVDIDILEQIGTTTAELEFAPVHANSARFMFPVPESASVVGFSVFRGGVWQDAHVTTTNPVTAEAANGTPGSEAVFGLTDYLGGNALIIDVPDLAPEEPVRVRINYIQILPYEFGEVNYLYPLRDFDGAAASAREDLSLRVHLSSMRPLKGYAAPGYGSMASVVSQTATSAELLYHATGYLPSADFPFSYGVVQDADLYVTLLADHEECGEDGFFLFIAEPRQDVDESQVIPKYFQFVMDSSGSMDGYKMDQAKTAARYFVDNLNGQDQFNVIAFNSLIDPLFPAPQGVSDASRNQARGFIDSQYADSMTNLHDAVLFGLASEFDPGYARILVLLTDGQPTEGITDTATIIKDVRAANKNDTRLFAFGIGDDVNKPLLTALATGNRGDATFLKASDDVSAVLAGFFDKIDRPVLTDVTVNFGAVATYDRYPDTVTDLFAGTQLLVLGRYRQGGVTTGTLTGRKLTEQLTYSMPLEYPECAKDANPFLPRLWAKAKIDALIAQMAEQGFEDPGIIEQIKALAEKYGIQTPYTSWDASNPGSSNPGTGSGGSGSSGSGYAGSYGSPDGYRGGGLEESVGCQLGTGSPLGAAPIGLLMLAWLVRPRRRDRS